MPDSVAGIALRSNLVFVARRKPGGTMGGKWEFPGGKCEPGEPPEGALIREYREELGLEIAPGPCLGVSEFENEGRKFKLWAYRIDFEGAPRFLAEHVEVRWVDRDALGSLDFAPSDRTLIPYLPS